MASPDYSPYQPLLNFLALKTQGGIENSLIDTGRDDFGGPNISVNPDWLSNPTGIFDLSGGGSMAMPASYNPFFSTEVRDLAYKIATGLGLSKDDANTAALKVAQAEFQRQGGQQLYSEATSPYIIADRIAQQLFAQAGKPYTPLTPEQQATYSNKAQDYQTQVKAARGDAEDSADLQSGLQIASVFGGPILGAAFGSEAGAGAGAEAGAGASVPSAGVGAGSEAGAGSLFDSAGNFLPSGANAFDAAGNFIPNAAENSGGILNSGISGTPVGVPAGAGVGGLEGLGLGAGAGAGTGGISLSGAGGGLLAGAGAASLLGGGGGGESVTSGEPVGGGGGLLEGLLGGSLVGAGGGGLGSLLGAGLGAVGSYEQTQAFKDLAQQYMAMGAPYRDKLSALYADPNAYLHSAEVTTPVQMGTDALSRSLSIKGNPFGSGHALQELQDYATNGLYGQLQSEKDRLANYGGLAKFASAAPGAATSAINASGGMYNALGYGLGSLMNPTQQPNQSAMLNMLGLA